LRSQSRRRRRGNFLRRRARNSSSCTPFSTPAFALGTVAVSLLFLDLGMRIGAPLLRYMAIIFAVAGAARNPARARALEPASASELFNESHRRLRSGTWAPPAYLLPLGSAWRSHPVDLAPAPARLHAGHHGGGRRTVPLFQWLPRYAATGGSESCGRRWCWCLCCGFPVGVSFWRRRRTDRIAHVLAWYALGVGPVAFPDAVVGVAASKFAMSAHFGCARLRSRADARVDAHGHDGYCAPHARAHQLTLSKERWRQAWWRAPSSSNRSMPICAAKSACATRPKCAR
jgi:hypothetical protein